MAYIETHQSLLTHRKTLRLARLLGLDRFGVAGRLMALWCWALDNAPDGFVSRSDGDILADVMGWDGEPAVLCEALVTAGFFELVDGVYLIHDWADYAGRLIEKRKSDAERKRLSRGGAGRPSDVQWTSAGHPRDGAGTVPNPTVPDRIPPSHDDLQGRDSPDIRPVAAAADAGDDPPAPSAVKPPRLRTVYGQEHEAMQLARSFADGLRHAKPDVKLPRDGLQAWAREFDLMGRVDHRPREKIEAVMAYAFGSRFWRSVVLSAGKLRAHFDTLDLQRMEDASGKHRGSAGSHRPGSGKSPFAVGTPEYYEDAERRMAEAAAANQW